MQIRFLRDFRSAATGENFYEAGETADLDRGAEIVAEGAAEVVTIDSRRGQIKQDETLPFDNTRKTKRGR